MVRDSPKVGRGLWEPKVTETGPRREVPKEDAKANLEMVRGPLNLTHQDDD